MRSIPACAGEPRATVPSPPLSTVYPRVCGGTSGSSKLLTSSGGLSPRVRGNRIGELPEPEAERSIPACAGEPAISRSAVCPIMVYPRVCGGTIRIHTFKGCDFGLSPRVRGNRQGGDNECSRCRSIPACAGEPGCSSSKKTPHKVYPRVCGGTGQVWDRVSPHGGLSPRVRGNLLPGAPRGTSARSIPACAGEPLRFYGS